MAGHLVGLGQAFGKGVAVGAASVLVKVDPKYSQLWGEGAAGVGLLDVCPLLGRSREDFEFGVVFDKAECLGPAIPGLVHVLEFVDCGAGAGAVSAVIEENSLGTFVRCLGLGWRGVCRVPWGSVHLLAEGSW